MCCGEGLTKTKMAKAEMGLEMCCGQGLFKGFGVRV
jgi:hypothetical protein